MNAWPHGVIVVPTVPTTATQYAALNEPCGITSAWPATLQSGCASSAETRYEIETPNPTATNRYWMRLKLPRVSSTMTTTPEMATLTGVGTPNNPSAAAVPANSATVEPRFATSIVSVTNAAHLTPNRSRASPVSPWPVASPSRAPTSCVKNSTIWDASRTQSRS